MTKRAFLLGISMVSPLAMGLAMGLSGCGGNVVLSSGGGSSAGGSAGNAGSGGETMTSTSLPAKCDGLDHITCLSAYPSCVPVYDDFCCPSCNPMGGCADCINLQFDHCEDFANRCTGAPSSCGTTPDWACKGGQADCNIDPQGGAEPCATVPGCLPAECSLELNSCTGLKCHAATPGTCSPQCKQTPPTCPGGTWPEAADGCYTGYCVPENVCVIGL